MLSHHWRIIAAPVINSTNPTTLMIIIAFLKAVPLEESVVWELAAFIEGAIVLEGVLVE